MATETVVGTFTCAVCKCVGCISEFMDNLISNHTPKEKYPPKLAEDWKEFFSPSIYNFLIPIFVEIASKLSSRKRGHDLKSVEQILEFDLLVEIL